MGLDNSSVWIIFKLEASAGAMTHKKQRAMRKTGEDIGSPHGVEHSGNNAVLAYASIFTDYSIPSSYCLLLSPREPAHARVPGCTTSLPSFPSDVFCPHRGVSLPGFLYIDILYISFYNKFRAQKQVVRKGVRREG